MSTGCETGTRCIVVDLGGAGLTPGAQVSKLDIVLEAFLLIYQIHR